MRCAERRRWRPDYWIDVDLNTLLTPHPRAVVVEAVTAR
jgi:hypothetical protein